MTKQIECNGKLYNITYLVSFYEELLDSLAETALECDISPLSEDFDGQRFEQYFRVLDCILEEVDTEHVQELYLQKLEELKKLDEQHTTKNG